MLIIGSHALLAYGIRIGRKPSDYDIIATSEEIEKFITFITLEKREFKVDNKGNSKVIVHIKGERPVEFERADEEFNPTGYELLENRQYTFETTNSPVAPFIKKYFPKARFAHPEMVLALKLSHRYLKNNPHFRKTMDDILALRGLKFSVPQELKGWLKLREKATYTYNHPSLMRDKKAFFSGDGVDYKYEHDDIHAALATLDHYGEYDEVLHEYPYFGVKPAYFFFQKDNADVTVDKEKWKNLDENIKLLSVLEESYVLAIERSQVPCDFAIAPRTSFLIALEKVCTSITSGWWREYAWENYYKVLGMYSDDYVDRFQKALVDGKIRDYQGGDHD